MHEISLGPETSHVSAPNTMCFQSIGKAKWIRLEMIRNPNRDSEFPGTTLLMSWKIIASLVRE